ncbi:MAG: hypothetical protein ACRERD_06680 [Candidatus Binatia bacterium]
MPPKDLRPALPVSPLPETNTSLQTIARFLQFLTWLMAILIGLLAYHVLRPQAGRYQLIVSRDEVLVFDSVSRQADILKKREMSADGETAPEAPTTGGNPPPSLPSAEN